MVSTVPELRGEIAKKHDQMVHIAGLLTDIDPTWDPKSVRRSSATHTQLADSSYVRLAMLELANSNLAEKLRSVGAKGELEEMLHVQTRNTKRWAIFPPQGAPYMSDDCPENDQGVAIIDAWRLAELIQARAGAT